MANDWIKIRTELYRDPKVIMMADIMVRDMERDSARDMGVTRSVTRNAVVGALVSIWGVLRHHGRRDGDDLIVAGARISVLDDIADWPGFGAAMSDAAVAWAVETDTGLVLPRFFVEHNTDPTELRREKNRQRKQRERSRARDKSVTRGVTCHDNVTPRHADVTPMSRTEKEVEREREREEEVESSAGASAPASSRAPGKRSRGSPTCTESQAAEIYALYPRKAGRGAAIKAIANAVKRLANRGIDDPVAYLRQRVQAFADSPAGQPPPPGGTDYRKHPATWFNQESFDDDPTEWQRANGGDGKAGSDRVAPGRHRSSAQRSDYDDGIPTVEN